MTRDQLEHLIRAAAVIADDDAIVIIGSQAILGQFPVAPEPMRASMEADLFPLHHPERADLIEGSIGELSPFHQTFGYYAQGVSEETAVLPLGWKERLVVVRNENTRGARDCASKSTIYLSPSSSLAGKKISLISTRRRNTAWLTPRSCYAVWPR